MTQPKVSIIVPIHNAGKYLEKCLSSLVNQTLKEIEIILILDCPTDGSDKIAERFASKDARIKLIRNEENLHIGYSRNRGLDVATGEYIGFHDHDDYSDIRMYELLYEEASSGDFDIVRCNFTCVFDNTEERYVYPQELDNLNDKSKIYELVSGDKVSCVLWNHIYKADFLKKKNIRFVDSRNICSEDSVFFFNVYREATRLGIVDDYLYSHVFHATNTGKSYAYRSVKNRLVFFETIYSLLKNEGIKNEIAVSYLYQNIIKSLYSGTRQAFMTLPFSKAKAEFRLIKENELVQKCIDKLYSKSGRSTLRSLKPTIIVFSFLVKICH